MLAVFVGAPVDVPIYAFTMRVLLNGNLL